MQRGRTASSLGRKRKHSAQGRQGNPPFSHTPGRMTTPPLCRNTGLRCICTEKRASDSRHAFRQMRSDRTEKSVPRTSARRHTPKKENARRAQKNWGMMDGHAPEPSQPPGDGGRHAYLFHGALTVLPLGAVYASGNGEVYPETRHERNLSRSAGSRDVLLHISNLNLN